jgi:hypothetical protein
MISEEYFVGPTSEIPKGRKILDNRNQTRH